MKIKNWQHSEVWEVSKEIGFVLFLFGSILFAWSVG
jgi:hypothetical protein